MQIQPDYSHQLEEIAKALNRPPMPQWEVALISAVVGALFTLAVQFLLKWFDNWWEIQREIHKIRRALYRDLLTKFQGVEDIMAFTELEEPALSVSKKEQLKACLDFDGEAYLKGQDVYMQLPERGAAKSLYAAYHRIVDDKKGLDVNVGRAKRLLAYLVEKNHLRRRYIKKFLGKAEAKRLLKRLHAIYENSELILKPPSGTTEPMDGK